MIVLNKTVNFDFINQGKDFTIFYEVERFINDVIVKKEYQKYLDKSNILKQKDLKVIDLGCNIGVFSFYIYDKASIIYAVDLSSGCIELLKQTINFNKFDKIKPICQAIAGANKKVNVTSIESTNGGNCINTGSFKTNAITLAQLFKNNNIEYIDLLKIDIEGAEYEVFEATDFKDIRDKIKVIIGECHRSGYPTSLEENGFICELIDGHFIAINSNKEYVNNRSANQEFSGTTKNI